MLETSNLARTHTYLVSENTPYSTKTLSILLMSAFFGKNQRLLAIIVLLQNKSVRAVLEII